MVAKEINVIFGFSNTNNFSAGTKRKDQPGYSNILSKIVILNFKKF